MGDDETHASESVEVERDAVRVRFTASREWVENELLPEYPAVTSVSQAARQACQDGVEFRDRHDGVRASIDGDVIQALRELGGEVENCQAVRIEGADDVVVKERDDVNFPDSDE